MADPQVYSIPLLTGQSRSAHPFFIGPKSQTRRSTNVWVDEQMRIRRRPGRHTYGDLAYGCPITGLFEYSYRSRASREVRTLVAAMDPSATGNAGIDIVSRRPPGELTPGPANANQSRARLYNVLSVVAVGVEFLHKEAVVLKNHGTGGVIGAGWVVADNIDYATPAGDLVIGGILLNSSLGTPPASIRIEGTESGASVVFDDADLQPKEKRVWDAGAGWTDGSVVNFAQFGNLLFAVDGTFSYPMRVWSGSHIASSYLVQAPRGKYLTAHQGRLWIAGLERNGSEIVASAALNPYSWNATARPDSPLSLFIEQDDRDSITGIARSYYGDLYVWKSRSLHRISGSVLAAAPPTVSTVTRSIGCISHRSIVQAGNDMLWASERGVHSLMVTDKYGDIETGFLSFDVSDIFEELNFSVGEKFQAVYWSRLGLYILGVATRGSNNLNLILVYSVFSKRWMTWDIGEFTAIAIGPSITGESESLYVSVQNGSLSQLEILDFDLQQDQYHLFGLDAATAIPVVLQPGTLFVEDEIRYFRKSACRLQVYHTSPGAYEATVVYSWDGGEEFRKTLDLNPRKDAAIGSGWKLGANYKGNRLQSEDQIVMSSIPLDGQGHVLDLRIEDSNLGRLPYLHMDMEYMVNDRNYAGSSRRTL